MKMETWSSSYWEINSKICEIVKIFICSLQDTQYSKSPKVLLLTLAHRRSATSIENSIMRPRLEEECTNFIRSRPYCFIFASIPLIRKIRSLDISILVSVINYSIQTYTDYIILITLNEPMMQEKLDTKSSFCNKAKARHYI